MGRRVADLLVETLQAAGVKTCFGIVGDAVQRIAHDSVAQLSRRGDVGTAEYGRRDEPLARLRVSTREPPLQRRDYHLLFDEQADQVFATTDAVAERVRKIGGTTVRSIGHIAPLQRVLDNDAEAVVAASARPPLESFPVPAARLENGCGEHSLTACGE
jgi:hypothetical protein